MIGGTSLTRTSLWDVPPASATPETSVAAAALAAHAVGLSVVPPREDGSKAPDVGSWKRYQDVRPDAAQLHRWYDGARTGVGLVCGRVSGGLEMLEFEGRAVADGRYDAFLDLAQLSALGPLVERIEAGYVERTPSGGIHLLYRVPTPLSNTKLASRPATVEELDRAPGDRVKVLVETRGEGGYVIVAPSHGGVHPTGQGWELQRGAFAMIVSLTDDERDDLFALARMLDELPVDVHHDTPLRGTGDRPGDRYNARADVQELTLALLVRHGWTAVETRDGVVYLRRPGKDAGGWSASLGHVGPGVLRVFTTSTELEAKAYAPFTLLVKLEYGGDPAAAAAALAPPITLVSAAEDRAIGVAEPPTAWPDPPGDAAYHGVLGEIVRGVAPYTEADPIALLGTLLAMFGAACGSGRYLYQGAQQGANLSILLVGDTSHGRKGTALSVARAVVERAYPGFEGLWLVGTASGEAITGHLIRNQPEHRVFLVEPEFGRLLTIMSREGSTLSAVLRNAWDGVPLGFAKAREEGRVSRHHVALLGHVTAVELRQKLTAIDTANGFANRLLFLDVRRAHVIPFPESPDRHAAPHIDALRAAITEAEAPRELAFDAPARERWTAFYEAWTATPRLGLAGAVTGRHEAQVARLALVYALADRSTSVGVAHLEAAIALAEYAARSVMHALGDSTGDRHADALRRLLADGEVPRDDARRELGLRHAADMDAVIAILVDAGLAEVVTIRKQGGGRPLRVIRPTAGSATTKVQTLQRVQGPRGPARQARVHEPRTFCTLWSLARSRAPAPVLLHRLHRLTAVTSPRSRMAGMGTTDHEPSHDAIPRRELLTLLAYVETGSYESAALRLGIAVSTSRARVSRLIRRVEARSAAEAVWRLWAELDAERALQTSLYRSDTRVPRGSSRPPPAGLRSSPGTWCNNDPSSRLIPNSPSAASAPPRGR